MTRYAMLILPALNRVYAGTAARLTRAELAVFGRTALAGRLGGIDEDTIGGAPYVVFEADGLTERDLAYLSNLSSAYALFERVDELLRPVSLSPLDLFGSDLVTIQKYPGKTNEHFTKLLLNVTAVSTDRPENLLTRRLRVLDPMCGRGTSLNQAMTYGLSATGVDIDGKDIEAYGAFIKTWLRNNRIKHHAQTTPIRRERTTLGRRLDVELAPSKEQYKSGELIRLAAISGDTLQIGQFCRARSFDVLVADAPYGVQHGSRNPGRSLSRRPLDLIRAALPGWVRTLRPGGAFGLSWNTHVASRADLVEALTEADLQVCDDEPYRGFEHRVDQAIIRDLVVARRPTPA